MLLLRAWMEEALKEARVAYDQGEVPVGALVVLGGEILARAHNECEARSDPTAHAELLAIRRACRSRGDWRLDGATLVATLEPCAMCAGAALEARLARVVFGAPDAAKGATGSRANLVTGTLSDRPIEVTGGVLEEGCRDILNRFFLSRRGV